LKRQHIIADIHLLQEKLETTNLDEEEMIILNAIQEKKQIEMAISKELGAVLNH
jgi:hypothetical protein